ncbi:transaldolase [Legionella fairfieldensis]|uniref:transaldolase n=1 Tax=Legionella fairfieldensis TaxID=45064 RepID=UPI00048B10B7|nr:transaldolase [Legionella fairfieldensis]
MNEKIEQLKVKVFFDSADKAELLEIRHNPWIKGITTNPTLMRKEGVVDFSAFAREILAFIPDKPVSFGVFSDDFAEMEQQALRIAAFGEHVYVKIPITNTRGEPSFPLIKKLVAQNIKLNITAVMTLEQVRAVSLALSPVVPSYVSVFAGRIADTGQDPLPLMQAALDMIKINPLSELIWASPRELFNIFQADSIGCHIITVTKDILKKRVLVGYDLEDYSLETVKMFHNDAMAAGFKLAFQE